MRRKPACLAIAALAAAGLAACTMVDSKLLDEQAESGCQDARGLGSYYLPKSYLQVEVWRGEYNDDPARPRVHRLQVNGLVTRPDPERLYCLDYLAAITAKDTVRVWKTEEGLLAKVTSRAEDQSAEILKKIIQTIFTLLIGLSPGPDPASGRSDKMEWSKVLTAEYDPTDLDETAFINRRLTDFGFCLISQGDPQSRRIEPNHYCERPKGPPETDHVANRDWSQPKVAAETFTAHDVARRGPRQRVQRGIFYRPRLPYEVFLFARTNRKVKGQWEFHRRAVLDIENHAPVISVGVERTFFATRATVLKFSQGVLDDVQLYKTSELEQFIDVPLEIVKQVALLPTNIVRFRVDQVSNEAKLKQAQNLLINAEADRKKSGDDRFKNIPKYKQAKTD